MQCVQAVNITRCDTYNASLALWCMVFAGFLLGFRSTLGQSYVRADEYLKIITYVVWLLVFASIGLNTFTRRHIGIAIVLLILGGIVFRTSHNNSAFFNMVIIIAARKLNLKKILTAQCLGIALACAVVVLCEELGFIPDRIMYEEGKAIRSLGFGNPNTLPNCFNMIVFLYVYVHYEKINIRHLLAIDAVALLLYEYTHCRTGLLLSLMLTAVIFLCKISVPLKNVTMRFSVFAAVSIAFVGVAGMWFVHTVPLFAEINDVLSGRLVQPAYYMLKYGLHPFGVFVEELSAEGPKKYLIDNGYALVLINYGFMYFFMFFGTYWKTISLSAKKKECRTVLALLFMLLNMLAETNACSFLYNWLIILCVDVYFPQKSFVGRSRICRRCIHVK